MKSCYLMLLLFRKMQEIKKNVELLKSFHHISPQQKHFRTWLQVIVKAMIQGYNFWVVLTLKIGHVITLLITHWKIFHILYSSLVGQTKWHFLSGVYADDPDIKHESSASGTYIICTIPIFLQSFWCFSLKTFKFPFLDNTLNPENSTKQYQQQFLF